MDLLCQAQANKLVHITICQIRLTFSAFFTFHLIIGNRLFKRQLKRITDIMEKCSQSPKFQEHIRSLAVLIFIRFIGIKTVMLFKCPAEMFICLINRQPEYKYIHRMGVMIAVLHKQGTAVGLKL